MTCDPDAMDTESENDTEELHTPHEELETPRHFKMGSLSFEFHEHYNNTADDEHLHLDTSSEDELSLME